MVIVFHWQLGLWTQAMNLGGRDKLLIRLQKYLPINGRLEYSLRKLSGLRTLRLQWSSTNVVERTNSKTGKTVTAKMDDHNATV
jgi:hypothetical protein